MKKYIYLDDEDNESIQPMIDGLNGSGKIEVCRFPLDKHERVESIFDSLKRMEYDGLIIDYKLDGGGPYSLSCNANTIAQYMRDLADKGEDLSKPIVLCSTDENLKKQLAFGYTSVDLYDYQFIKDFSIEYGREATVLESLVEGYDKIRNLRHKVQNIVKREISNIDERPFNPFFEEHINVQKCADVIIKDLFKFSGILITKEILCARLGIAMINDYLKVLSLFDAAKYIGVFSELGEYYWMDIVNEIFYSKYGTNLAMLNAGEKMHLLSSGFGDVRLEQAKADPFNNSTRFWTICETTKVALDPQEGYRLKERNILKPWQEHRYVSFSAISSGYVETNKIDEMDYKRYLHKVEYMRESMQ